jgi:chromate transporter
MAIGFIAVAAWRISKKVIIDKFTFMLMFIGTFVTYHLHSPWIFPIILAFGGSIAIVTSSEKNLWNHVAINPPWRYLILFISIALSSVLLNRFTQFKIFDILESFYRYGYLVFGGGQVVVPVMVTELVEQKNYMSHDDFLTGFGFVQGLPGPMFSFAAFAGGLAMAGESLWLQLLGIIIGGVGIFLPGILLIYFIFPVWELLKQIKAIKVSLKGINAVAGGMIIAAVFLFVKRLEWNMESIIMIIMTVVLLSTRKIPAPSLVLLALLGGILI